MTRCCAIAIDAGKGLIGQVRWHFVGAAGTSLSSVPAKMAASGYCETTRKNPVAPWNWIAANVSVVVATSVQAASVNDAFL
jgi:hypothetical protein